MSIWMHVHPLENKPWIIFLSWYHCDHHSYTAVSVHSPRESSVPLTTIWASSSCSWAWSESRRRLELRNWLSTCWAFRLSVVALRRFSAPSLIFSSFRISLRIRSRCSSNRCWTLESEKSELWSKPSCSSTDNPPGSLWKTERWTLKMKHSHPQLQIKVKFSFRYPEILVIH